MIDRIKRIPELRFSNFYNEWQEKKLGDLGKTYTGLSGKTKTDFGFGDSHFITYMNVFKNNIAKFEMTEKVKISNNEKQNKVNYGDIFFTTSSEVPQEVGMTSIWLFKTNNVYLNSFCFGFRVTINNVLPIFLARYLRSENIRKKITILAQGSTRFNLSKKEVMKLSINFPEINEQQKIGDFFSKLDRQIELEEQKLAKLEEQKKGYMQKIFSKELRFKDENGNNYPEWEEKKLKELIDVRDGTHESPKPSKEGYLLVTSKNLKNSKLDLSESYFISKEDYESINQRSKVEIGDILFGMIGTIGNPILLEECDFAIKNVALLKTNDLLEKYYILNFLKSSNISKQFYRMNAGGTQKFIALSTIRDLNIDMPSSEEAIKIGNFFNKVDNLIENQSNKLELLKKRKQGFLQKMFI
ncbi:restriction endonuclease subunit S [Mammaliicoccus fleurettii]|uniref:restriction endonuclease subunit S n=1 Tax=Mammaliicoccus fleurettii TaxID=150056 RepID=UPI002DB7A07B|nr:restriction endonuclease subunit S [Mammaliicoccus fleurettii]MEB8069087.1 restriction endonuclease subunit S [Mammaliicoccus fleurettii]